MDLAAHQPPARAAGMIVVLLIVSTSAPAVLHLAPGDASVLHIASGFLLALLLWVGIHAVVRHHTR